MTNDRYPPPALLFALASDLLDHPNLISELLGKAQAEGRQVVEFNFNITDVTVDFSDGSAVVADVLDADAETATLSTGNLLSPFDLASSLPDRCTAFVKAQYGQNWKNAIVWLSALPNTSQNLERLATAAIVQSGGDLDELERAVSLGRTDWRDLLMNGGLGDEGWRAKLDKILGLPDS